MVFLEDVVHLSDVLTGNGFDYEAVVVAGEEAVVKATLGVTIQRGTPSQRVLMPNEQKAPTFKDQSYCL